MIYSCGNGRILFLTVEQYLDMSDIELEELCSNSSRESFATLFFNNIYVEKNGRWVVDESQEDIDLGFDDMF